MKKLLFYVVRFEIRMCQKEFERTKTTESNIAASCVYVVFR